MSRKDGNKKYRDTVFRDYFNEPERLLSLCNAILDTQYDDIDSLKINTLEGIFFDKQKNDISCTIGNNFLILVEHQTSVNNNMPFRCLSYVTELLNNLVTNKKKLYHKMLIRFPAPRFIVLYDGDEAEPLKKEMRLSDAFGGDSNSLELVVTAYNINYDLEQPLLAKCRYLQDYSILVGKIKEGIRLGLSRHDAISHAVKFCLNNGLMKGYLEYNSQEVFNMLALEWNMDDALQARFEDGYENGRNEGINVGIESVALNLISMGMTVEKVQEATLLPRERIEALAKKIKN
ncbi:MAG: Rpn family recombination-promoting nuclease/putative transposase [Selenomonadaceae bacterium]|nr:Rpn family recombination-promoting nuclease/putative transposase [Selenomonadaceae bacterium]MBR0288207.1 Rpn family recombination-promoting nuclease/putative transposase [Selenomonadaceae bacterium]